MNTLKEDFSKISSHKSLSEFVTKYELIPHKDPDNSILTKYSGTYNDFKIEIVHKWHDRCKTFEVRPDRNEIIINVTFRILSVVECKQVAEYNHLKQFLKVICLYALSTLKYG